MKKENLTWLLSVLVSIFLVAGVVLAITQIGLNISTDGNATIGGTLQVNGTSTLATTTIGGPARPDAIFTVNGALGADVVRTGELIVDGTTTLATTTVNGTLTIGSDGTPIAKHLSTTTSITFNLDTADTCTVATTSLPGAAPGDTVAVGMPEPPTNDYLVSWGGWVLDADTVALKYCTGAATTTDDTYTVRFDVWKH